MKKFFLLILFIPAIAFSQTIPGKYITTEGVIKSTELHHGGRSFSYTAEVEFVVNQKDTITSQATLFLGFFRNEGDKIKLKYNSEKPYIVYSMAGYYIQSYGWFILIGIGVISSVMAGIRRRKKANEKQ